MEQINTPYAYYRGGTSKAAIVLQKDVPTEDPRHLDEWILALYGSPDRRQIDGIGGADILTSKFAVVGPSTRSDADVDYSFYQVDINRPRVLREINCGNISAAIGPFAIDAGLVKGQEPFTDVRIHATNYGRLIHARVGVLDGKARVAGTTSIDGVPGTGAPIELDFRDMAGCVTGKLLPTGNVTDVLDVPEVGHVEVSIVDLANLVCYVDAGSIGLQGTEDPVALAANEAMMEKCDRIRRSAAVAAGLVADLEAARDIPIPWISIVSRAQPWLDYVTSKPHEAADCDITARLFSRRNIHKAYPGTGSACLGAACEIRGSIPNRLSGRRAGTQAPIRIGHPCGVLPVLAQVRESADGGFDVKQASMIRTARRIADGTVYVPTHRLSWLA